MTPKSNVSPPQSPQEPRARLRLVDQAGSNDAPGVSHPLRVEGQPTVGPEAALPYGPARDAAAYAWDVAERTILFWDTLRQRAENMLAHERAGKPPLLDFDYEMLLDARRFEHPTNYSLLRITTCPENGSRSAMKRNAASTSDSSIFHAISAP